MASLHEAVENFKNAIVPFQNLVSFVDRLGEVADLESAAEAAKNELARAVSEKDQVTMDIASQVNSLNDLVAKASEEASEVALKAQAQAEAMIQDARDEAAKILSSAQDKQNKINREVEAAEAKRDEALTAASRASDELNALDTRIAKARASMRKLLDLGA